MRKKRRFSDLFLFYLLGCANTHLKKIPSVLNTHIIMTYKEETKMSYVDEVIEQVVAQNPAEPEFHQAVKEVLESLKSRC